LSGAFFLNRRTCPLILVIDRQTMSLGAIESVLAAASLCLKQIRIGNGNSADAVRLQITLYRTRHTSVFSAAEQLCSLPGVREIRHQEA
jgi:hypothetical protein